MKEQFVPYEIALKLKEKGFDEECLAYWVDKDTLRGCGAILFEVDGFFKNSLSPEKYLIATPLWQQVIDWFRVVHKIYLLEQVTIDPHGDVYYGVVKTGKMYRNTEISEDPIKAKQFAIEYALTLI